MSEIDNSSNSSEGLSDKNQTPGEKYYNVHREEICEKRMLKYYTEKGIPYKAAFCLVIMDSFLKSDEFSDLEKYHLKNTKQLLKKHHNKKLKNVE